MIFHNPRPCLHLLKYPHGEITNKKLWKTENQLQRQNHRTKYLYNIDWAGYHSTNKTVNIIIIIHIRLFIR